MKMKNFLRLKPADYEKYAGVFNLGIDELKDVERIKNIKLDHES